MHELSVTQALFDLATQEAESADADRILSLKIQVGILTGIVPDSVRFYWEMIAKDSIAEKAALHFEREYPGAHCQNCGHVQPLRVEEGDIQEAWMAEYMNMTCESCGARDFRLEGGRALRLLSMEVE